MSSKEWKTYKLGDLVKFQRGHDLSKSEFVDGNIPIVGSNGIIGYHNKSTCNAPCITIGRSGSLGTPFFYNEKIWAHNTTLYVKEFYNSDPKFMYYLLQTIDFKQFNSGSAVPSLNRNYIHPIEVVAPELQEQQRIASILSSLDDKIELNRQTNQTLEGIAQTLFQEMCVPKGEELPEGWRVGKLEEVLEIKYGKDHKHLEDGLIPVYGSGGIMRYANKALYEHESILIPRKGTLSNLFYINKPFWSVDTMFYTKIKNKTYGKFLFLLLKTMNLASMNVGSAVPSLTTQVLNNIEIILPSDATIEKFDDIVTPMFTTIESNEQETQTLIALRDSLLPKLMKGEIEI